MGTNERLIDEGVPTLVDTQLTNKVVDGAVFVFETVMRVRSAETDFSGHLTMDALIALLSEARCRYLHSKGANEYISGTQGVVVTHTTARFVSLAKNREELLIEVGAKNFHEKGGDFYFRVTRMSDFSEVSRAVMGFVVYDYEQKKEVVINENFKNALSMAGFV